MYLLGAWDVTPNISEIARELVKSRPCWKGNGHSLFYDLLLLVTVYGYI